MGSHHQRAFVTLFVLGIAAVGVLLMEASGRRTTFTIHLSGDVAKEARWVGQYGQFSCVAACAALVWFFDARRRRQVLTILIAAVLATAGATSALKRLSGRVRPTFDHAGQFLGPSASTDDGGHDASLESFPSGHTAAAVALTVVLSAFYTNGRPVFWTLAIGCGALRWIRDAHWLSDVLAGAALGFAIAHVFLLVAERCRLTMLSPTDTLPSTGQPCHSRGGTGVPAMSASTFIPAVGGQHGGTR